MKLIDFYWIPLVLIVIIVLLIKKAQEKSC